ncbi:hypothetical protein SDC9_73479 [bioreactor metagenome]|uniref:Uncharacterized protein n=1 Tax=bioreactor metagenome TaxID=1076179 RepID=A0A644YLI5_9ZZZZ
MPGWGDLYLMNERFSLFYYVHCICMFIDNEHTNTMNNQFQYTINTVAHFTPNASQKL